MKEERLTKKRQVLAVGFLLVILSSAIWHNFLPLIVVATYIVAPLPNWICSRCANPDDFMDSSGNSVADFGRFMTGFLVLMGVGEFTLPGLLSIVYGSTVCCLLDYGANKSALPAVLAHSGAIEIPAMVMSIIGGLLIYGTIISFSMFFQEQEEF